MWVRNRFNVLPVMAAAWVGLVPGAQLHAMSRYQDPTAPKSSIVEVEGQGGTLRTHGAWLDEQHFVMPVLPLHGARSPRIRIDSAEFKIEDVADFGLVATVTLNSRSAESSKRKLASEPAPLGSQVQIDGPGLHGTVVRRGGRTMEQLIDILVEEGTPSIGSVVANEKNEIVGLITGPLIVEGGGRIFSVAIASGDWSASTKSTSINLWIQAHIPGLSSRIVDVLCEASISKRSLGVLSNEIAKETDTTLRQIATPILEQLLVALSDVGLSDDSQRLLSRLETVGIESPRLNLFRGIRKLERGEFDAADAAFRKALNSPSDRKAKGWLGVSGLIRANVNGAQPDAKVKEYLGDENVGTAEDWVIWQALAQYWKVNREPERYSIAAMGLCERTWLLSTALDPAIQLADWNRPDDAAAFLKFAMVRAPEDPVVRSQQARALRGHGKLAEAEELLTKTLAAHADCDQCWLQLWLLKKEHAPEAAISELANNWQQRAPSANAYLLPAQKLEESGDLKAALKVLEPVSNRFGTDAKFGSWYVYLLIRNERLDDAVIAANTLSRAKPEEVDTWLAVAAAARAIENYEAEATAYNRALRIRPQNVDALTGSVIVNHRLGRRDAKAESLERLRKVDANAANEVEQRLK